MCAIAGLRHRALSETAPKGASGDDVGAIRTETGRDDSAGGRVGDRSDTAISQPDHNTLISLTMLAPSTPSALATTMPPKTLAIEAITDALPLRSRWARVIPRRAARGMNLSEMVRVAEHEVRAAPIKAVFSRETACFGHRKPFVSPARHAEGGTRTHTRFPHRILSASVRLGPSLPDTSPAPTLARPAGVPIATPARPMGHADGVGGPPAAPVAAGEAASSGRTAATGLFRRARSSCVHDRS